MLDSMLPGIKIGRQGTKTTVVTYPDDVNIFLKSQQNIPLVLDALTLYKQTMGARVNIKKSSALALGTWDKSLNVCNIPYRDDVRILGVRFTGTVNRSAEVNWENVVVTYRLRRRKRTFDIYV
jgi:hypothetical protein